MLSERSPWASLLNSGRTLGLGTSRLGGMNTSPKSTWNNHRKSNVRQLKCFFLASKEVL